MLVAHTSILVPLRCNNLYRILIAKCAKIWIFSNSSVYFRPRFAFLWWLFLQFPSVLTTHKHTFPFKNKIALRLRICILCYMFMYIKHVYNSRYVCMYYSGGSNGPKACARTSKQFIQSHLKYINFSWTVHHGHHISSVGSIVSVLAYLELTALSDQYGQTCSSL